FAYSPPVPLMNQCAGFAAGAAAGRHIRVFRELDLERSIIEFLARVYNMGFPEGREKHSISHDRVRCRVFGD
ncbi:MAG: hypothetical protein L6Q60_11710, partial [Rhodocyclaceae bacterium]|nr:hypothetical protein [Rhodocyclaceae bacterium]